MCTNQAYGPSWLLAFAVSVTVTSTAAHAVTKEDLISGIRRNYEAYRKLKSAEIIYTLDFEPLTKPSRFGFMHLDVINISRGNSFRTQINAKGIKDDPNATQTRIATWDGKLGMVAQGNVVKIQAEPDNLLFYYRYFFDYMFYPEGSARVVRRVTSPGVDETDQWIPTSLERLSSEYHLKERTEFIDEAACWLLERPGRDRLWIDAVHGCMIRRREYFTAAKGELKSRTEYLLPSENDGFWYPKQIVREDYAPPVGKPELPSTPVSRFTLRVTSFLQPVVNQATFRIEIPQGGTVVDSIRKMTYEVKTHDQLVPKTIADAESTMAHHLTFWEWAVIVFASLVSIAVIALTCGAVMRSRSATAMSADSAPSPTCKREHPTRSGFTLLELLVVLAIIGLLMGLLMAGVQRAREAAARTGCQNNLRQLGLALHNFESQKGQFPSMRLLAEQHIGLGYSWAVELLPYLELASLSGRLDLRRESYESPNIEVAATPIKLLQCPSVENPRFADYNNIGWPVKLALATTDYGPTFAVSPAIAPDHADGARQGMWENSRGVRTAEITDGLSNTTGLAEVAGRPQRWIQGRRVVEREPVASSGWIDPTNGLVIGGSKQTPQFVINYTNADEIYAFHSVGAYAAMADGSVRLMSVNATPSLVVALITRAGGEQIPTE